MQRIAAPMVGGMLSAPLLSMIVIPAAYYLMHAGGLKRAARTSRVAATLQRASEA
jgi:Cu(I)/Ag(I) efflux system membrane protein CusA/SilA